MADHDLSRSVASLPRGCAVRAQPPWTRFATKVFICWLVKQARAITSAGRQLRAINADEQFDAERGSNTGWMEHATLLTSQLWTVISIDLSLTLISS